MKLYIGNLPWSTTEEELKELFNEYQIIGYCKVIRDRDSGRSKGFGFVEVNLGDKALQEMNGKEFKGRVLKVNKAVRKENKFN